MTATSIPDGDAPKSSVPNKPADATESNATTPENTAKPPSLPPQFKERPKSGTGYIIGGVMPPATKPISG